jgi:hypothetical protein
MSEHDLPSTPPIAGATDPEMVIRLPFSALHTVVRHLYLGAYSEVAGIVAAIEGQLSAQLRAIASAARAASPPEIGRPAPADDEASASPTISLSKH